MFSLENITRKNIASLKAYSSARSENLEDGMVFLDANEFSDDENNYYSYPEPQPAELLKVASNIYKTKPENMIVARGADEIIDCLFKCFTDPEKDKVLINAPTYGMYEVSANIFGVEVLKVPLTKESFGLDLERLNEINSGKNRVKIVFICNPNNPTGSAVPSFQIEKVAQIFAESIVVVDEAYIDFSEQGSAVDLISNYPNIVVLKTLSKSFGLAGLRVGFAIASLDIISTLKKVVAPYPVPKLCADKAVEVLKDLNLLNRKIVKLKERRQKIVELLSNLRLVRKIYPSQANFILVEFSNPQGVMRVLKKKGIIVRDRSSEVEGTLRISIGTDTEMKMLFAALDQLESEIYGGVQ